MNSHTQRDKLLQYYQNKHSFIFEHKLNAFVGTDFAFFLANEPPEHNNFIEPRSNSYLFFKFTGPAVNHTSNFVQGKHLHTLFRIYIEKNS